MKKAFVFSIALVALFGCQREQFVDDSKEFSGVEFRAAICSDGETKTALDGQKVVWSRNDSVTIFKGTTRPSSYVVKKGTEGTTDCTLEKTESFSAHTENGSAGKYSAINQNVAVSPLSESLSISDLGNGNYEIAASLPTVQKGVRNSFGLTSFPMVAVTKDADETDLSFKNTLGLLKLSFSNSHIPIKRIVLRGNASEKLSGAASIKCSASGVPSISMLASAADSVVVEVKEDTTAASYYVALPPVSFTSGLTVTIDFGVTKIVKTTTEKIDIVRSASTSMAEIVFGDELKPFIPENSVSYISETEMVIKIKTPGSLSSLVTSEDRGKILKLHVLGKINVEEVRFIINKFRALEYLDLEGAECSGSWYMYEIENGSIDTLVLPKTDDQINTKGLNGLSTVVIPHPDLHVTINSHDLKNLVFKEGLTDISAKVSFSGRGVDVVFPTTTQNIANPSIFMNMYNSYSLVVKSTTPPTVSDPNGFVTGWGEGGDLYETIITPLFVPAESLSLYQNANGWKQFVNIYAIGDNPEDYVSFADAAFKAYCVNNFDTDGDGRISLSEASVVQEINVSGTYKQKGTITSLTGIEHFTALKTLLCPYNQIEELDVRSNTSLTVLNFSNNKISGLNVSFNPALTQLYCQQNQVNYLDVSENPALTYLNCSGNSVYDLDVSKNTALTTLDCQNNKLTTLDVSKSTALKSLHCDSNQLTSLDVSKNTALTTLYCDGNQLTSLDVSKNTALTSLRCGSNQLTSLDVSKNTVLKYLWCYSNQLTSLDVSKNTSMTDLKCYSNQLTSLDVSKNTALTSLLCGSNQLTSLDVSKNTSMTNLHCDFNQLTSLDVSKNASLKYLSCKSNKLTTLDVSKNTALTSLLCGSNQLTSLDVSNNTALNSLNCTNNSISEIWLKTGQTIEHFNYDKTATVKYKD